jgi:hypothetical protein
VVRLRFDENDLVLETERFDHLANTNDLCASVGSTRSTDDVENGIGTMQSRESLNSDIDSLEGLDSSDEQQNWCIG